MEVAGLVLGGIPLILYAIDNYHRCLQATADYWRYESTVKLIRSHVFVQQQQFQITLRSIGLVNPTPFELEEYLRQRYPDKYDHFIDIIARMEKLLAKLMDKLDIDLRGRPRWTTESPERAVWEWRRVRRGFGRSSRQKLIDELQFWNDALRACFDKTELPLESDTPTSAVEAIRSRFSPADCNDVRQKAIQIHRAVSRAWRCQAHQHLGNLKLSWHTNTDGATKAKKLSLVFPPTDQTSASWHEITCEILEPTTSEVAASTVSSTSGSHASLAHHTPQIEPSPRPWKRMKGWFHQSSDGREAEVTMLPIPPPLAANAFVNPQLMELPPEVNCICSFLHGDKMMGRLGSQLGSHNPDDSNTLQVRMERLDNLRLSNAVPLGTVFGQATLGGQALSRKDRFAVAAAATWAVLYLAGSPWIGPDWSGTDRLRLLTELEALQLHRHYPAIPYTFTNPNSSVTGHQQQQQQNHPDGSPFAPAEEIKAGIVRNKTLFALGILLIELSLDLPFAQLRAEFRASSLSLSLGITDLTPLDDYEVANACMQRVYLEAGDLYGYAVQRCLRCEFPGRDVTKSFEFEQFRSDFFHGVVAPVQATFDLLQAMHDVLVPRV